jgi:hypothetical protein
VAYFRSTSLVSCIVATSRLHYCTAVTAAQPLLSRAYGIRLRCTYGRDPIGYQLVGPSRTITTLCVWPTIIAKLEERIPMTTNSRDPVKNANDTLRAVQRVCDNRQLERP